MENVIVNPVDYSSQYIKYLNKCFGNWGEHDVYNWVFNRVVGSHASDIVVFKDEDGEVIAGSGVTYRKLRTKRGNTVDIAIMTGSWTLPQARGKGCFSKMINISKELAANKKVPYLTAFVTESNASFRRLQNAGSVLLPTYHLFSPTEAYTDSNIFDIVEVNNNNEIAGKAFEEFKNAQIATDFDYTAEEFEKQYICRPNQVKLLKVGAEYLIVEETQNVLKVIYAALNDINSLDLVLKSLTNWSLKNVSKKVLLFSTRADVKEVSTRIGFENLPGYFTILSTVDNNILEEGEMMSINIHSGDKM